MGTLIIESALLDKSDEGFFYVEDREGGRYEIDGFLGDVGPVFQIFSARYTSRNNTGDHQIVALKLAQIIDLSYVFLNLRKEVDNSFNIGPNDDPENNIITADNIIIGIYKSFMYRTFFCVSMPYMKGGSLRSILNSRMFTDRKVLIEKYIAVVLRETLKGLCFLHGQGKVHGKLNAAHIYLADCHNSSSIKLGYLGSTYFHDPGTDSMRRIWEERWRTEVNPMYWQVSRLPENEADYERRVREMYEPSENKCTSASDIWNLGITAIELALGGLRHYQGNMRSPEELRSFLTNFLNNDETGLPKLRQLLIPDPPVLTLERLSRMTDNANIVMERLLLAARKRKPADPRTPGNQLSSSFIAMVRRCLVLDPDSRPTAQMLLNDPFFVEHQVADLQH